MIQGVGKSLDRVFRFIDTYVVLDIHMLILIAYFLVVASTMFAAE